jgi:hypothetical protein
VVQNCPQEHGHSGNSSFGRHLADVHDIHQQAVVAEELLEEQESNMYNSGKSFYCPYPGCLGMLNSGWMMRCHFRDINPKDFVELQHKHEGFYPLCERCEMQCNPSYPTHINTKECRARTKWWHQWDMNGSISSRASSAVLHPLPSA